LKEAGYDNEPVVLLYPSSFAILNKFPPVMAALLKQAGFNVDLQSMDWPTFVARRALKAPPAQGGWGAFITGWNIPDNINPLFYAPLTGTGESGWFGWPTDARVEALKDEFLAATTEDQRKALADKIQERVFDAAIVAPIGEYKTITAVRKDVIRGTVTSPVCVFWGIHGDPRNPVCRYFDRAVRWDAGERRHRYRFAGGAPRSQARALTCAEHS
jgi:peptide/nickel transport system substrate-binding protein